MNHDEPGRGTAGWMRALVAALRAGMGASGDRRARREDDGARVGAVTRWFQFLLIIAVLATGVGLVSCFAPYVGGTLRDGPDVEWMRTDTKAAMWRRFAWGAGVGGLLGAVYMVRCLMRDEDP